jgi:dephospho-CoA kinase
MLKIGLTGGIGCGKSTVAQAFSQFNIPIIDADLIAHQLVQKGQPALAAIHTAFGAAILNADGSLNRKKLKMIIFSDAEKKHTLEAILHPQICQTIHTELEPLNAPYCLICLPLLFEAQLTNLVDRILVVDCPVETQIKRVKVRDQLSLETIQAIIDSQVSRSFRITHADDLIDNSESGGKLAEQVKRLHNLYLSISQ